MAVVRELSLGKEREDPAFGTISYTKGSPDDRSIEGIFSFSLYFTDPNALRRGPYDPENIYLKGIQLYAGCITQPDSIFQNWRIVVYTDLYSKRLMEGFAEAQFLLEDPKIDLVIVDWPYYSERGSILGDVMRVLRFRAFFDFPSVPVFVRDADTIWTSDTRAGIIVYSTKDVYKWEKSFVQEAKKFLEHRGENGPAAAGAGEPGSLIFGASLSYSKYWHVNKRQRNPVQSPIGALAGFQNVFPPVACFQNFDLWNEILGYILRISRKTGRTWSNRENRGKIGKDEQILLYIVLPACRGSVIFFELDINMQRSPNFRAKTYKSKHYPREVLKHGSNKSIAKVFELSNQGKYKEAILLRNTYLHNLQKNRRTIAERFQAVDPKLKEVGIDNMIYHNIHSAMDSINSVIPSEHLQTLERAFSTKLEERNDIELELRTAIVYSNAPETVQSLYDSLLEAEKPLNQLIVDYGDAVRAEKADLSSEQLEELIYAQYYGETLWEAYTHLKAKTGGKRRQTRKARKN